MVAGSVLMAVKSAIAKRLAGKLNQPRLPVLPNERKIVGKRITVPDVTFLHEDLYRIDALRACAPAHRPFSGPLHQHIRGAPSHIFFLLSGQVTGDLVMVAMSGNLMPLLSDGLNCIGVPFSDAAASQKSRLDFDFVQHSENPPNTGFRSVFAFGIVFVVDFAVRKRPDGLSTLKIESYRHRHPTIFRPEYFSLCVIFSCV